MKRLLPWFVFLWLLAATPVSVFAAGWDGQRGPFTVTTYSLPGSLTNMGDVLIVALRCSDESITAARVDIEYRDILGLTHTLPLTTEIMFGNGGVFTVLPEIRIIRILFTARKDAGSF